ncbi:unnamed protein product, partial [Gadus morhua 'NCC']
DCKCPASGQGTEDGRPTAGTWRWFAIIDELIGRSAAVSPPVVVGSLRARPGRVRVRVEEEDEVGRTPRSSTLWLRATFFFKRRVISLHGPILHWELIAHTNTNVVQYCTRSHHLHKEKV